MSDVKVAPYDGNPDGLPTSILEYVEEVHRRKLEMGGLQEKGTTAYSVCRQCGNVTWVSHMFSQGGYSSLTVRLAEKYCDKCHEVKARAPELVLWVGSVVKFQIEIALQKHCETVHPETPEEDEE